jgi:hypothetical protein
MGNLNGIPSDVGCLGVEPDASDLYDLIDAKMPSEPRGPYVYAWFERPARGQGPIMADWRAPVAEGTSKVWGTGVQDTWNVKTDLHNGPSGCFDPDCDIFNGLEYPIAAHIYITWAFGLADNPLYPVPPSDYVIQAVYRDDVGAKPAGTGSPGERPFRRSAPLSTC